MMETWTQELMLAQNNGPRKICHQWTEHHVEPDIAFSPKHGISSTPRIRCPLQLQRLKEGEGLKSEETQNSYPKRDYILILF